MYLHFILNNNNNNKIYFLLSKRTFMNEKWVEININITLLSSAVFYLGGHLIGKQRSLENQRRSK